MNGLAIAARPLGHAGLGVLAAGFPGAHPTEIRIDPVLAILAEAVEERATGPEAVPASPTETMRATRP
jgi:hypothetical protein